MSHRPNWVNSDPKLRNIVSPCVYQSVSPSNSVAIASVEINDEMPHTVPKLQFTIPIKDPTKTPTRSAAQGEIVPSDTNPAVKAPVNVVIAATERSSSPQSSGAVSPRDTSANTPWLLSIVVNDPVVRNELGVRLA